jgi:hypothetical protein
MNRYQLEFAELDRRQRLVTRSLSFAGAGLLIVVALWSAGLPPSVWFTTAEDWFARLRGDATPSPAPAFVIAPTVQGPLVPVAPSAPSASMSGTESSISSTPLPLYLLSTAPGRNFQDGTAQLGTSTTNPQTYAAGALLANGATLAEIHSDHVLLKRGERTAKLSIFKLADNSAGKVTDDLLTVGGSQEKPTPLPVYREVLTDYLRPSPVYDGEMLRGYQVYPGQRSGVFAQLGLQPGDVIIAINDAPFVDPTQAMQMFGQLTDGTAVVATVERKNKSIRITLDGTFIVADQEQSGNSRMQQVATGPPPPT